MTVRSAAGATLLGVLFSLSAACSDGGDESADRALAGAAASQAAGATSNRPDSATVRDAELALLRWLDRSRESNAVAGAMPVGNDPACDDVGGSWFPSTLLADYVLLATEFRGDTIVGRAEVVTVAEQDVDRRASNRFVARQRVQQAILEWDVIPTDDGAWAVCNGLRFGYRGSDSLTTWRPDGSSYQTARALADSIVRARQSAPASSSPP